MIPKTAKIHIWEDFTRTMNNPYESGADVTSVNSKVIIVEPTDGTYKNIPSDSAIWGQSIFGSAEGFSTTSPTTVYTKDVNGSIEGSGNNNTLKMKWEQPTENPTIEPGQDNGTAGQKIVFSNKTDLYYKAVNPFSMGLSGGGIGSVLTTCYEVEASGNYVTQTQKNLPAYQDKYKIDDEAWFRPGKQMSAAEAAAAKAAWEKSWTPGADFGQHYMFYIMMIVGGLVLIGILVYLVIDIKDRKLVAAIKAVGKTPSGE